MHMLILTYYLHLYWFQLGFALLSGIIILSRRAHPRVKLLLLLFTAVAFCRNYMFNRYGHSPFVPDLPEELIRIWTWAHLTAMAFLVISLLCIVVGFICRYLRLPPLVIFLLSSTIVTIGMRNDMSTPIITERTLEYSQLPAELDGYRLLHISDLHCSSTSGRRRTEEIVSLANSTHPDLICITGDIADGNQDRFAPIVAPLANLRARDGVYYVTGNHEYFQPNSVWGPNNRWMRTYRRFGMQFLHDKCIFPHPKLALGGIRGDITYKRMPATAITNVFAAATNGEFRLLMHHYGGFFDEYVNRAGVQLMLAGDTHGGILPGRLNRLTSPGNRRGYFRGFFELANGNDHAWLNVSPGVGQWAPFPMRFFNPPEITLITLRRSKQ